MLGRPSSPVLRLDVKSLCRSAVYNSSRVRVGRSTQLILQAETDSIASVGRGCDFRILLYARSNHYTVPVPYVEVNSRKPEQRSSSAS